MLFFLNNNLYDSCYCYSQFIHVLYDFISLPIMIITKFSRQQERLYWERVFKHRVLNKISFPRRDHFASSTANLDMLLLYSIVTFRYISF